MHYIAIKFIYYACGKMLNALYCDDTILGDLGCRLGHGFGYFEILCCRNIVLQYIPEKGVSDLENISFLLAVLKLVDAVDSSWVIPVVMLAIGSGVVVVNCLSCDDLVIRIRVVKFWGSVTLTVGRLVF